MHKYFFIFSLVLTGCATATKATGPNRESAYEVSCGNAVKSKCEDKAKELCPTGYHLLNRPSDAYRDSSKVGNLGALELRADTTTKLLIVCH